MQARFLSASLFALAIAAASSAVAAETPTLEELLAQGACPEQPICAICKADIPVGQAVDPIVQAPGAGPQQAPSSPPPPPPPPPPNSGTSHPTEQLSLNYTEIEVESASAGADRDVAAPQDEQASLLLPAVQSVREAARPTSPPPPPPPQNAPAEGEGIGLMVPAIQRDPPPPPPPQNAPAAERGDSAAAQQEQPRRRRNFSISLGGVTVGTNGVNVAVGDVNGDGRSSRGPSRTSGGSATAGAPRR